MGPDGVKGGGRSGARRASPRYDWITVSLDRAYQQVAAEPIPDRWMELLKRLDDTQPPPHTGSEAGSDAGS